MTTDQAFPWKAVLAPALINAVINGYIAWDGFAGKDAIALTVDSIGSGAHTVFGGAVLMATALGLILSLINFAMERKHAADAALPRRLAIRAAIRIGLKNAFFLFGLLTCSALLWQKLFGSLLVSPLVAATLTAIIAGLVTAYLVVEVRDRHRELQDLR